MIYSELDNEIILCILLLPLFLGIISIFLKKKNIYLIQFTNIFGYFILLAFSFLLLFKIYTQKSIIYEIGLFKKYGVILIADLLTAIFLCLTSIISFFILLYSTSYFIKEPNYNIVLLNQIFNFMIFGINGILLTGDLFNLYIFFEIMFLSSSIFIIISNKNELSSFKEKIESSYKYIILGFLSSSFLLLSIIFIYASIGSLNLNDIS